MSVSVYFHTHWDREWYLPFRTYQHRLLGVVDSLLEALDRGELPCFTLDGQTVLLEDYLAFRPHNAARQKAYVQNNQLSIGPWYVMPDEFLVSGESLIRNLELGLQIAEAFGETTFTGYLPDTFGHSADIPQILRQFELDSAVVWRGVAKQFPFFTWQSPSGDTVLTYHLTEGYFQNLFHMGTPAEAEAGYLNWKKALEHVADVETPVLFPLGADHLGLADNAYSRLKALEPNAIPLMIDTFMFQARHQLNTQPLKRLYGELRDEQDAYILPGVFSSRLYLKQWNRRLEWRLTRQVEQLLCWQSMLKQPIEAALPQLQWAWKTLLLNHPHDSICGCSVDAVHIENEQRFVEIDQVSLALLRDSHKALTHAVQPAGQVVILNLSDAAYTGVVDITQHYPLEQPIPAPMANAQVLSQIQHLDERYLTDSRILPLSENQAVTRHSLVWVQQLPAHSMMTLSQTESPPHPATATPETLENDTLKITWHKQNGLSATVKATGATHLLGQLVRHLQQGDSYNAAPVPGTTPQTATLIALKPLLMGPLRASWQMDFTFTDIHFPVKVVLQLDAGSPRVDWHIEFTNNTPNHKIQWAFTGQTPVHQVLAEGHFAPIVREYDPNYRLAQHMPAPKLKELKVQGGPIQRWVSWHGQTLITEGLTEYEVESETLSVTLLRAFGMLSRDDTGVRGSHAGPPLPTPDGQCIGRACTARFAWLPTDGTDTAFHQSDWFYGAIYGFDRVQESDTLLAPKITTFLTLDNPRCHTTAWVPLSDTRSELRILNPHDTPQHSAIALPLNSTVNLHPINLRGNTLTPLQNHRVQLLPYRFQTVSLQVQ